MLLTLEKGKKTSKKEMKITLKSKPLASGLNEQTKSVSKSNDKSQNFKKKGTRGVSWIG